MNGVEAVIDCPAMGARARADVREAVDADGNEYRFEVDAAGRATILSCLANTVIVKVPPLLDGCPVAAVGDEAFATSIKLGTGFRPSAAKARVQAGGPFLGRGGRMRNDAVERVLLPEGVASIGRSAFRGCARLVDVALPDTLERIGDYAFSCSGIRQLRLPARCVGLSDCALRTGPQSMPGAGYSYRSKVDAISVAAGNRRYSMHGQVLCRCLADGRLRAELCPGTAGRVDLRGVSSVHPYAFAGTHAIDELVLDEALAMSEPGRLLPNGCCSRLTVVRADGSTLTFDIPKSLFGSTLFDSLGRDGRMDVAAFAAEYDALVETVPDALDRVLLMLARLAAPAFLSEDSRSRFADVVRGSLDNLCAHVGARGMWDRFDLMADAGVLDASNVGHAVQVLTAVNDPASVGYLLNLKRSRFEESAWDYDL